MSNTPKEQPRTPSAMDQEIERIFVDYANDKGAAPLHRALERAFQLGRSHEYAHPWAPGPADGSGAHHAHAMRGVTTLDVTTILPPVTGTMLPLEKK